MNFGFYIILYSTYHNPDGHNRLGKQASSKKPTLMNFLILHNVLFLWSMS